MIGVVNLYLCDMSSDVTSPTSMRHSASSKLSERFIPLESSLVLGLLIMIPLLVVCSALGFLLHWWVLWTLPALALMILWLILFSRTREVLSQGMWSDLEPEQSVHPVEPEQVSQLTPASEAEPAQSSNLELAQARFNSKTGTLAKAVDLIHQSSVDTQSQSKEPSGESVAPVTDLVPKLQPRAITTGKSGLSDKAAG